MNKLLLSAVFLSLVFTLAEGQEQSKINTKDSSTNNNEFMRQLLDLSRPGNNHSILGKLSGRWNFQERKLAYVKGTIVRKPVYDGRFYIVEMTGGKLQVPIANGKMKEDNYQEMRIEGYANSKKRFVIMSINNHISSDIEALSGTYDSTTKTFTYLGESELITGMKTKNKMILKIIDDDHYLQEFYREQNGIETRFREVEYTRID